MGNLVEIQHFLSQVKAPDELIELHGYKIDNGRKVHEHGYYNDRDKLAAGATAQDVCSECGATRG